MWNSVEARAVLGVHAYTSTGYDEAIQCFAELRPLFGTASSSDILTGPGALTAV